MYARTSTPASRARLVAARGPAGGGWGRRPRPRRPPAPAVIAAYRRGAEEAGREPGEIVLQTLASWAPTNEQALESSREWKGTLVDEHYTEPIADPAQIGRDGEELADKTFESQAIVSADPETHVKRIRTIEKLGATAICVMNVSGADPLGMLRTYGESVLPELRSE